MTRIHNSRYQKWLRFFRSAFGLAFFFLLQGPRAVLLRACAELEAACFEMCILTPISEAKSVAEASAGRHRRMLRHGSAFLREDMFHAQHHVVVVCCGSQGPTALARSGQHAQAGKSLKGLRLQPERLIGTVFESMVSSDEAMRSTRASPARPVVSRVKLPQPGRGQAESFWPGHSCCHVHVGQAGSSVFKTLCLVGCACR